MQRHVIGGSFELRINRGACIQGIGVSARERRTVHGQRLQLIPAWISVSRDGQDTSMRQIAIATRERLWITIHIRVTNGDRSVLRTINDHVLCLHA